MVLSPCLHVLFRLLMVALSSPQQTIQSGGVLSPERSTLFPIVCTKSVCVILSCMFPVYWLFGYFVFAVISQRCVGSRMCVSFIPRWSCSHSAKVKELHRPTQTHTHTGERLIIRFIMLSLAAPSSPLSPAIILLDISPFHLQMTDTIESGHSHSASGTFSSKNRDHNKSQCGQGQ